MVSFDYPLGLRGFEVAPATLSFDSVALEKTQTREVKLINRTGSDVTVSLSPSPANSPFQWSAFKGIVSNGEEKRIPVTFRAMSNGFVNGKFVIVSSSIGSPHSIGLTGKGGIGGFPVP